MRRAQLEVDGRTVTVSNLDKVLYPEAGMRKADVIDYVLRAAAAMLPHLTARPVTRLRRPGGVPTAPFFEKALPAGAPEWIPRYTVEHTDHRTVYPVVESAADLVWLAQLTAVELHVPQWRIDLTDGPDRRTRRLVLDLDPGPGVSLRDCARVAVDIRAMLDDVGLASYPVTSGGTGIHVYARTETPMRTRSARAVARQIATTLAQTHPRTVTATMAKAERDGRVFIDWSQNSAAKTTAAPYSLRDAATPLVAAPRSWDELSDTGLAQLTPGDVLRRIDAHGDLLAGLESDGPPHGRPDPEVVDLGAYRRDARPPARAGAERGKASRTDLLALRPMLASDAPVDGLGDDWAYEGKWDGYRTLIRVLDGRTRLISRTGADITDEFPQFATIGERLRRDGRPVDAVFDGEIVALDDAGITDFALLTSGRRTPGRADLRVRVFDILHFDGVDLWSAPFDVRREVLDAVDVTALGPLVEVPPLLAGPADAAVREARANGWEGIVAKRRDAPYSGGRRSPSWRKQKNWRDVEVVVGGYRTGRGSTSRIGSLLVGLPAETGLRYVGRVGTGFTDAELADLAAELAPLRIGRSPFIDVDAPVAGSATWVLPTLVADVRFMNWTSTGHLRHPSWRGIRRDKLPGDL
ncbi:non-homologous end-joining DNA ligase [Gordonia shandongensis]|uniref:non-homologous end-joining DNA ligase n=1 Tax=Gordonia shandongensis TaxID=376351 RepID=UPI00047D712E|nr:non-homologous end-joining DNA ligase [Gordonia shandongensis]